MRKRLAFTLVELLVVIGIIALLISILLPSLSRARGAASSVDCQARLRQVGMGLQLYGSQNKGLLPWGLLWHDAPGLTASPNPYSKEVWWKWHYTVSQELGTDGMRTSDDWWGPNSQVFTDRDTIEGQPWGWRNDYIANQRLFPSNWSDADTKIVDSLPISGYPNGRTNSQLTQVKLSSVRNASEAMAVWDGPQISDYGNNSIETASFPGGWQFGWGTYYTIDSPMSWASSYYDQYLHPGQDTSANGAILQKTWNKDYPTNQWASAFRFRHMNNTSLNALFTDGHVESKKVGEIKYRDICVTKPG
jgi:prepilin-type N-terminal cleavage/methylation domain-containing protein/prepilin-type processing-associated H-X9-DG protein